MCDKVVDLRNVTIIDLNSCLCSLNTVYLKENLLAHYFQVFNGHHLHLFLANSVIAQLLCLKSHSFMAPFFKPLAPNIKERILISCPHTFLLKVLGRSY